MAPRSTPKPGANALTPGERNELQQHEATIKRHLKGFYAVGTALSEINRKRLYREQYATFDDYVREVWSMDRKAAYRKIKAAAKSKALMMSPFGDIPQPASEGQIRSLLSADDATAKAAWQKAVEANGGTAEKLTGVKVKEALEAVRQDLALGVKPEEFSSDEVAEQTEQVTGFDRFVVQDLPFLKPIVVPENDMLVGVPRKLLGSQMARYIFEIGNKDRRHSHSVGVPAARFGGRPPIEEILEAYRSEERSFAFNTTNEHVDWADFTWNPITGCRHTCGYCYARSVANMRYRQGFRPTLHTGRLLAPRLHTAPRSKPGEPISKRNVFTCSMADLYGERVPDWAIEAVHDAVRQAPEWRFLMLTKFPQKLASFTFPENAWIGTTVDTQDRVKLAEKHFAKVEASVKWLSCEPLLERLTFDSLETFDCVVIGAEKGYDGRPDKQPDFEWVMHLMQQAQASGTKIYWKDNLAVPKQLPDPDRPKMSLVAREGSDDAPPSDRPLRAAA